MSKTTITRALVELKTLDKRIKLKIREGGFISVAIGKMPVTGFVSNDQARKIFESNFDSIRDLINRRHIIKKKIVQSNATTMVNINEKHMTVTEAIERKNSIDVEKDFLNSVTEEYVEVIQKSEAHISSVEGMIQSVTEALVGKQAKLKDQDIDKIKAIADESHKTLIIDPIGLRKTIETMRSDIDYFIKEVDISLSESNTRTEIEI